MCPRQRHPTTPYAPPNLRPKPANLPSLHGRLTATMSMHVRPPLSGTTSSSLSHSRRKGNLSNLLSPYSLTRLMLSSSRPCTLVLLCTMRITHESAQIPRVPQSKSTCVHHLPPLVYRHELFAWPWPYTVGHHVTSYTCTSWAKRYQIHTILLITRHPRVTTIGPHFLMFHHYIACGR